MLWSQPIQIETIPLSKDIVMRLASNLRLKLGDVARLTGISRHRIQRAIKEECGCSFRDLKKRIQIDYVNRFLSDSHRIYSIKEIAAAIGITPNALSRFIKVATGYYPTELRRLKW